MPSRPALAALLAFAASLSAQQSSTGSTGPARPGAVGGVVRDPLGHPIQLARVSPIGTELSTETDSAGHFLIKGLSPGEMSFAVRKIGLSPVDFAVTIASDSTRMVDIRLRTLTILDAATVTATGVPGLHRAGFYERMDVGLGTFITPERLDKLAGLPSVTSMIVTTLARGATRVCLPRKLCDIQLRMAPCRWLFIDGRQMDGVVDEFIAPTEIAAVEIYDRVALVPAEFQGRLQASRTTVGNVLSPAQAGCGAVVLWTKGRVRQ